MTASEYRAPIELTTYFLKFFTALNIHRKKIQNKMINYHKPLTNFVLVSYQDTRTVPPAVFWTRLECYSHQVTAPLLALPYQTFRNREIKTAALENCYSSLTFCHSPSFPTLFIVSYLIQYIRKLTQTGELNQVQPWHVGYPFKRFWRAGI